MEITLLVLVILFGFALIVADILFIPGGFVGTIGGLFILGAIITAYKLLGKEIAFLLSGGSIIFAGVLAYISVKFKLWKIFVREDHENRKNGFTSSKAGPEQMIGRKGKVATDLRPAGTVIIDGKKYDAVTEGGFIGKGKKVEVVTASVGQIKVKEIK
jgi:membrane-bound serine protease (ClpP class)